MDSACPKELATEILSDSDHSTKVAPTTLKAAFSISFAPPSIAKLRRVRHKAFDLTSRPPRCTVRRLHLGGRDGRR